MHQYRVTFAMAALLSMVIHATIHAEGDWCVKSAERPKIAIQADNVTVDGTSRPDLGRALADSLSTKLLRRGQVRVFNLTAEEMKCGTQTQAQGKTPTLDKDIDYLLSFNLFSNASEHRLTVKKTRISTSELIDSYQFFTYGRVSDVFALVDKVVDRVDPLPVIRNFPVTQSPAAIRAAQPDPIPYQQFWTGDYTNPGSPVYDPWRGSNVTQYDLNNVPKALVYRELGSIQHIDTTWRFTVVKPVQGVQLCSRDPLHVLYDEGDVYANLRVGTVEQGGVIADYGGMTPEHHKLFNGDKVFGWYSPHQEKAAKTK